MDMAKPIIRFKGYQDDWEQRKLSEFVDKAVDNRGKTPPLDDNGIHPLIEVAALGGVHPDYSKVEKYLNDDSFENNLRAYIKEGDILFTTVGSIGLVSLMDSREEAAIAQNIVAFRAKENFVPEYLYSLFSNEKNQYKAKRIVMGAVQPSIKVSQLVDVEYMLTQNVKEQQKIGEYFSKLDQLITLHQRKCDETKKLKKYMLQKMFPQNGEKVPEIRFSGFTDDWEQRKLSEVATMHARIGWQNLRTSEFLDSGDYMLITGTDFNDGAINYSTCHFVERERYEQDKHIQIKNGSILITKDGTLGKVAYVQGLSMPATLNAGVFNVEIKDETEVDSKYLFQYLKAPFLMDYVDKKATGGTIKHLNQNILVDFPVLMPSKTEQEAIGVYFERLDNLVTLHQRELENLQNIKRFMLGKMFV